MKRISSIFICLVLCACSNQNSNAKASANSINSLNVCFIHSPSSPDPRRSGDMVTSSFAFMLFDGLTNLEKDGSVKMALAKSYDVSDDGKTYTFHLRPSTWSDGTPLTASDFEYAWKSVLSPDFPSPCSFLMFPVNNAKEAKEGLVSLDQVGVKALDDLTFQVKLKAPCPYFLKLISFYTFFPTPKHIDSENPMWYQNPSSTTVCNGPFKIKTWAFDSKITVERNPTHWDADQIEIKQLTANIVHDENTMLQMFEQGTIDWMGGPVAPIPLDALPQLVEQGKITTDSIAAEVFVTFNTKKFPFNNVNIRKAFALAVDRSMITENVSQTGEIPASSFVPTALVSYDQPKLIGTTSQQKIAEEHFAKGLEELGISAEEFPKVTLSIPSIELYRKVGQAIQQQIQNVLNVELALDITDLQIVMSNLVKRNYDLGLIHLTAQYHDPMNIFERFMFESAPKNYPDWHSDEYVRLIDASLSAENETKRAELFIAAEKLLADEMPFTPIYFYNSHSLINDTISGVMISAINSLHFKDVKFEQTSDIK